MNDSTDILVINSDLNELERVKSFLLSFFNKCNLPEDNFNRVFLCLSEGVINSIHHGNQNDKQKKVNIQAKFDNGLVNFEISDEGDGFDFENVKNPTQPENLKKESGRGLHIIRSYCKELDIKESGKCIQFKIECK